MRRDVLYDVVLRQIRKLIYTAKKTPDIFIKRLQTDLDIKSEEELKKSKSEMQKLQKRNAELEKIISKLFEDRALDKISEERYFSMTADFENQLKEIRQEIEKCKQILISSKQNTGIIDKFTETISNYDDAIEKNPDAKILCTLGVMGDRLYEYVQLAALNYTEETGDTNISTMKFDVQLPDDGYSADWHPSITTYDKAAEKLTAEIKSLLS